jgi:hypothetical protein
VLRCTFITPGIITNERVLARSVDPFTRIKDHILLPFAAELDAADARMSALITPATIEEIIALIPETWLGTDAPFAREVYTKYLQHRLRQPHAFVQEAIRARSQLV